MKSLLLAALFVFASSAVQAQDDPRMAETNAAVRPLLVCANDYARYLAVALPSGTPDDTVMAAALECMSVRDEVVAGVKGIWGADYKDNMSTYIDQKMGMLVLAAFEDEKTKLAN